VKLKYDGHTCVDLDCGVNGVHHHVAVEGANGYVDRIDPGPRDKCNNSACRADAARVDAAQEQDEALNAVQKDLIAEAAEIAGWWVDTAKADAERTVPKAVEYGAADFDLMGQFMVALIRDKFIGADEKELMQVGRELAVTFYLIGKMGRAVGAYSQGMRPSGDTIFDTRVYAMMWQRIRDTGSWINNG
jgi:hypothetical protein